MMPGSIQRREDFCSWELQGCHHGCQSPRACLQFSGMGAKFLFRSQNCEILLACFTLSLKIIPNKKPMFDMKYLFPGQSKYLDFPLSLQPTQWHSGASSWCGSSAGGHPSAPAWLGLHHLSGREYPTVPPSQRPGMEREIPPSCKVLQSPCRTPASQAFIEEFVAWTNWCTHSFSIASCISAGTTRLLAVTQLCRRRWCHSPASEHLLSSCALAEAIGHALCRQRTTWAIGCWRSRTSVNGFLGVLEG